MSRHAHQHTKAPRSRIMAGGLAGLGLYTVGALYPPEELRLLYPISAPPPIADHNSPEAIEHTQNLEAALQSLPLLQAVREAPDANEWYETRPYANTAPERRANHFTGGALKGPSKLAISPLVRSKNDETEAWIIVHVGRGLCGHEGIIHGGLLATLLDESLGREALVNLPEKVGVTATLEISYRAPTKADQFIVIKTKLDELKGRKAWVSGTVEDVNGKVLVQAKAMFVQPKYAALLNKKGISEALGERLPATTPPAADGKAMV
ncbi:Thioesterase/thiol ester dehydrase-isomerase [Cylindrobasidium torrendii FP15055 ss-10]|uniref:Thioesterase/thiol ester dehydrase-isomerase n=1 Tax=Cylindrobasidium torrendii FP15055 ss-10 TaxID=1314674 RepID=A0A0D7AYF4_9AGAR|nr:Thioesterase/thiol ester dehydrase-isomerase [Cylindrobasidium torrendii FP15055 ss-10]